MHGLRTIRELNAAVAAGEKRAALAATDVTTVTTAVTKPDIKVIRYQDRHVVVAHTPKGQQFIDAHYQHEREVLGGRLIGTEEYFSLKQSQAKAFGLVLG